MMTREAWDIIQSLGGYAEVSRSMTGAHVFVMERIPGDVDGRKIVKELNEGGHVEIYGYPANGRGFGTTWLHIEGSLRHTVPEAQNVIDELVDKYVDDENHLSDQEQAAAVIERYQSQIRGDQSGGSRSKYYGLDPVPIANTGSFWTYGRMDRLRTRFTGRRRLTTIPGRTTKTARTSVSIARTGGSAESTTTEGVRSN